MIIQIKVVEENYMNYKISGICIVYNIHVSIIHVLEILLEIIITFIST